MRTKALAVIALLLCASLALAQDKAKPQDTTKKPDEEAKEVSGMSIVGNSETPKSLTIIPWKSSQIGRDTDLKSSLLGQDLSPIDKPTFLRGIDFYKLSNRNPSVKEF
ncbi:MAG: hypothetical protein Tsb007_34900 [Rhizobacter sp.]